MEGVNKRFVKMAKEFHKDHGCIGSESFETCTADICVIARSVELFDNAAEEIIENSVQPLSSRLQGKIVSHVSRPTQDAPDGGYCVCETPEQPWWGDAFTCHRCNRPRR